MNLSDTIVALSTAQGTAAIAVIRISGNNSFKIIDKLFQSKTGKSIVKSESNKAIFGEIIYKNKIVDEVIVTTFKNPKSYTGEDIIEISCHGSEYIQKKVIELIINRGARMAEPGEFTLRAYLNKKMDLSQAESVADLISSKSESSHHIAINHLRGGISNTLGQLRQQLLEFTSLIELELDFSEEDVVFADRKKLFELLQKIKLTIESLLTSFSTGNAIKNGIPVSIVGIPNVGKSSLLNALFKDKKAIVSNIEGTTRDSIEDTLNIGGILYRFIDTAGLRETKDEIESIGIEITKEKISSSKILIYMVDISTQSSDEVVKAVKELNNDNISIFLVINKIDISKEDDLNIYLKDLKNKNVSDFVFHTECISTFNNDDIEKLKSHFSGKYHWNSSNTLISNQRHWAALQLALESINAVINGLDSGISSDLLTIDIKQCLHEIGTITGEVTTDDILGNIFSNFCIGK